ncbi:hypothetical protein ASD78_01195 [Lysobacter sp. Root667]|uniref:glycosyltransferase n=1 Tax=Lysobacter sp. Root667 TaxID=1736581 RepID=UPI000700FABC|nr:glycosyltransferase [Lysobacter sp. Root667]KRA81918.1 hypothetical protein ASD78_01195 [Lysobacter sp. Root667]
MRHKVLTVGYAQPGFGFGRVMGELHEAFAREFRLHHLDQGTDSRDAGPVWPPRRVDAEQVWAAAERWGVDAVFLFSDLEFVAECAAARPASSARLLAYVPIDSPVEPSPQWRALARLDALAVYTRFARDSLSAALARMGAGSPRIEVVPHGCDVAMFRPLDGDPVRARALARDRLFGAGHALDHSFIVLNANRNQPRKRIDLTLRAFRRFLDLVPQSDARLYLHMGLRDCGIRILPMAADLGLEDRLLLTQRSLAHPVVDNERLNAIYNACDVGLNTADAEGWGLVSFEHAATGRAQLIPEHTGCGELWQSHACMIAAAPYRDIALDRPAYEVDVEAAAGWLARLYRDQALRERYDMLAFAMATQQAPTWPQVGRRLAALIGETPAAVAVAAGLG